MSNRQSQISSVIYDWAWRAHRLVARATMLLKTSAKAHRHTIAWGKKLPQKRMLRKGVNNFSPRVIKIKVDG